jgi:hypothetical protein
MQVLNGSPTPGIESGTLSPGSGQGTHPATAVNASIFRIAQDADYYCEAAYAEINKLLGKFVNSTEPP